MLTIGAVLAIWLYLAAGAGSSGSSGPVGRRLTEEDRAKMVQSEDCGDIVAFLAELPEHVCINELTVSPTWNRGYVAQARRMLQG